MHLSFEDAIKFVKNMVCSKSKYLLAASLPEAISNKNIAAGMLDPVNLSLPPFDFLDPILVLKESNIQRLI